MYTMHDILCKHQSSFRAIHLTVTALLEAADSWAFYKDIRNINALIILDLKKAEILLSKLDFYGMSENSLKWFQSYLGNRIQQC